MLDAQNKGPQCTACGSPMTLTTIGPSDTCQDSQKFACLRCKRVQRYVAGTGARLNPQRENAVTYEINAGRMISKPAT